MISLALVFVRLFRVIRIGFGEPEFRALFAAAMFVLLGGMVFYMYEEDWSAIDALYFCVTTLTTIGFGDIVPISRGAQTAAIFEGIVGTLFLAILIAKLVGIYPPAVHAPPGAPDETRR
jgi:hypothetical protein